MKIFDLEFKESLLNELSENNTSKIHGGTDMVQAFEQMQQSSSQESALRAQEALAASQESSAQNAIALRNTFDQVAQSSKS